MTVSDMIDYLQQFPGNMEVVIDDDTFTGEGDYVSLTNGFAEFEDQTGHFEGTAPDADHV